MAAKVQRKMRTSCQIEIMILPSLVVAPSLIHGRGVFTTSPLAENCVIEISPVIIMNAADRLHLDQTLLHDYIFEWGEDRQSCCMALGYVPIYNHGCPSNCEYEMDFEEGLIRIKTVRAIEVGEELLINYHGDATNAESVWFNAQ
jgi:uncharacterized protein